ncbi:MAG: peptide ABC transporter substrate-binding protein [Vicinamibacteria bacterium]|nr:peptide ABC transporter substrate-binding protein [Vicinamibacteria bacterium]
MTRSGRGFALTLIVAASLAGCSTSGASSPQGGGGRILRVAYDREIDVLNVFTSQNLVDISFSMVEGLVTTNERNEYIPVLAKEIPTEANGRVVRGKDGSVRMTWPLQENVRWHDGLTFTSADVCFTWRFVTDPKSMTYNREQYIGIKSCEMPDAHTVVFVWDGAYAYYAGLFEGILPRHVFLKADGKTEMTVDEIVNYEPYNRGPGLVGTGPFRFAEWKTGEYIRVVRNPEYWRGKDFPKIDEIVWAFIPDNNTRLLALKSGRYDWGRIQPTQVSVVRNLPASEVHLIDANSVMHFDLAIRTETGRALFDDVRVRRAIFHAIDREGMAKKLMEGAVKVAEGPINPNSPYHNAKVTTYPYDLARSRRLLDEAGWTMGEDGVRRKNGRRFSFVMLNRAGSTDRILLAQVIQAGLKAVGVEVNFETLESAAWTQRWRSGKWEAIVSAWFLPADPGITGLYACKGANNMAGFCDPALDEILERSDQALSFETRMPLLHEAQAKLAEQARMLPLYQNVMPEVVTKRVSGYRGSGTNFGSFWNLWQWRLDEGWK